MCVCVLDEVPWHCHRDQLQRRQHAGCAEDRNQPSQQLPLSMVQSLSLLCP